MTQLWKNVGLIRKAMRINPIRKIGLPSLDGHRPSGTKLRRLMLSRILLVLFVLNGTLTSAEEPPHEMIELSFYYCKFDHALRGGVWGKGPFKSFGPKPSACRKSDWETHTCASFKQLASKNFGITWEKEIPFWRDCEKRFSDRAILDAPWERSCEINVE